MKRENVLAAVDDLEQRREKYPEVATILEQTYGRKVWKRRGSALDTLIGTILSQNTTDKNSSRAFNNLKDTYDDYQAVLDAPEEELIEVIRVAGLANQKGPRIQRALRTVLEREGEFNIEFLGELGSDEARDWLTEIKGIGLKTASIVVCFGFGGNCFPVDTHVNRTSQRIGFTPEGTTPNKAHYIMEEIVPPKDYFAFHIQLIQHGRELCKSRKPKCDSCPLTHLCDYYQQQESAND